MILGLGITLVVLVIALWLFTIYASYKIESGIIPKEISMNSFFAMIEKFMRLMRRGYYASLMYFREATAWSHKKIGDGFVKIVPNSAQAFVEKDELTGLTAGPLSFFLQSISESRKKSGKRLSSSKKML